MTPTPRHFNILFLCTGNSARSIMAEAILNRRGFPNFTAYSAGSHPTGHVHPEALRQIASADLPTDGLRSKSWDEFAKPDAPRIHYVFTVCDRAANEVCPIWPGHPLIARWGVPDPAPFKGRRSKSSTRFPKRSEFWIEGSICSSVCHWPHWNEKSSKARSIVSAGSKTSALRGQE